MGKDNQPKHRQKSRDLHRKAPTRKPFERLLIVCEGGKTEPLYLDEIRRAFRLSTANVQVLPSTKGTAPLQVVNYAESLFLKGSTEKGIKARSFDRVMAVFDRDSHPSYHNALARIEALNFVHESDDGGLVRFEAIASVPCFELWLLLHFEDVQAAVTRADVYARLNKHLPKYAKGKGGHFKDLIDRLGIATARATACATQTTAHDGTEPYTDMHTLVNLLMNLKDGASA